MVVGLDRKLSYYKLTQALLCARLNPGCLFVATNDNGRGLFIGGQEWPGAGACVAAVTGAQAACLPAGRLSCAAVDELVLLLLRLL